MVEHPAHRAFRVFLLVCIGLLVLDLIAFAAVGVGASFVLATDLVFSMGPEGYTNAVEVYAVPYRMLRALAIAMGVVVFVAVLVRRWFHGLPAKHARAVATAAIVLAVLVHVVIGVIIAV
ncbi:MAG: hypothetical protein KDA20_05655 [Phycisphaerales bacterium]|nr:hypothetical protein [Phycisphaerales bacterium]